MPSAISDSPKSLNIALGWQMFLSEAADVEVGAAVGLWILQEARRQSNLAGCTVEQLTAFAEQERGYK